MEEMTEQEALYILRNCYVMKTEHTLDEENAKLKQAIKKILKTNKHRNNRNKELREKNKKLKIKLKQAYIEANNYLYFNDSADYEVALWEVIRSLRPDLAERCDNGEDANLQYINKEF